MLFNIFRFASERVKCEKTNTTTMHGLVNIALNIAFAIYRSIGNNENRKPNSQTRRNMGGWNAKSISIKLNNKYEQFISQIIYSWQCLSQLLLSVLFNVAPNGRENGRE